MVHNMGTNLKNLTTSDSIPVEFTEVETSIAAATLMLIMALTIIGNSTICLVIFGNKRTWNEMNMFLLNLALGDIASCMSMGFSLVTAIKREWCYGIGSVCTFNGLLTTTLFCNTIFTHTMISVDRYIVVTMPMKKVMTKKKAALMILGGWVLSLAIALAPLFGWGSIGYNGTTMQCGPTFPKNTIESLYISILPLVGFIFPIAIMSCVYTKIYVVIKRHTQRISVTMVGRAAQSAVELQEKVALTFFLALNAFILCWSPFCAFTIIAVVTPSRDHIPHGLGIAAFWCGYFNGACNPFIIGLRSQQFYKTFNKLLCWPLLLFRRRFSTESGDGSSRNVAELPDSTRVMNIAVRGHAFTNGGLTVLDEVDGSRKVKSTARNEINLPNKAGHRRSGVQEHLSGRFVFESYIHVIDGKVWNEAAV